MKKFSIFFLSDNFPPERNAAATRVSERGVYWVEAGHDLSVLTSVPNMPEGKIYAGYKNRWFQRDQFLGIKVFRVKTFIAANEGFALRILDFLSYMVTSFFAGLFLVNRKHDFIVATSPQFFTAVSAWALAKVKGKPFIFELGDLWPESIRAVGAMKASWVLDQIEKVELFLYRQSAAVIALTDDFKANLIRRGIPAEKIFVVKNGVDLRRHSPQPKDEALLKELGLEDKFVVSYIGTMGSAHDLLRVLQAAKALQNSGELKVVFLFVGAGAELQMLKSFAEAQALRNVVFVAPQGKERIGLYWNLSDIALVHLKNSDTFRSVIPSKMFEAMGYAKPVLLVAPQGEASQILMDAKAGWHLADYQESTFLQTLKRLSSQPEEVRRVAQTSLEASKQFTRERQANEFIAALSSLGTK
ncbi:glycosyltransferase family 4 protein [Bdellovibrio sp. HCB117]|uniref:glycosyltransferase family 4 protein n=1 Tax=Bdellovibrio sp. HCB117 TaxID=3394359 RepID=UPI0039B606DE